MIFRGLKMILRFTMFVAVVFLMLIMRSECYSYLKPLMFGEAECIDDDWESHPIGSTWFDNSNCEKLECVFHKNTLYAKGYGCSAIGVPSGCQLVPGRGIVYPNCCPQVQCQNGIIW